MTAAPATPPTRGPLDDLRVIEMGQLLAGPFCGQLFADFGAEVIKLEAPGTGDPMRQWGREKPHGQSLWWPVIARNKKSVELNAREKDGQDLVKALVAESDILLENFRPGTMEKWGLGYDELAAINPRLIMVRVSGYGQTGPYARKAGYGSIGEAMGGLRYVVGDPSTPPSRMGISIGDTLAATFACIGALTALHAVRRTGRGQVVDSAIYEAVLTVMESLITEYDKADYVRERTGPILPNVAPSNVYPTSDGLYVLIAANQDTVFARLADAMGRPELATDPRYATHSARGAVQPELDALRPGDVSNQTARFALDATVLENVVAAAERLTPCHPDALLVALSTEMFPGGLDLLRQGAEDVATKTGLRVFNAPDATQAALRALEATRVSIVTPFDDDGNTHVRAAFEASGFTVPAIVGLNCPSFDTIAKTKVDDVRSAFAHADRDDAEVLVHVGTGLPLVGLIDALERERGKPVVGCNPALYWQALRETGVRDAVHGYGRLLAEY